MSLELLAKGVTNFMASLGLVLERREIDGNYYSLAEYREKYGALETTL